MATFDKKKIFSPELAIEYSEGGVISKQITKSKAGNIMLFSFDKGEGLSEHTTPFDAVVQLLDGEAEITIGDEVFHLVKGISIIMPANVPHSLMATERFKMLLTMIKDDNN
ncbi:cupin domain-containing protein [Elizabethkingia sp. JS20170427COW]|uniref:cupin domain-containing protein n=1 Tax=Elizabethkingia sp. JS20170427COW TaxID=2583851 RepID=UPI0011107CC7|nr:cupin domain-containing protein [Elizabethkingia sp. JS20170427COW]QCX54356.1 cupin domain-containing protein [Elizabethkingia sp. JS20170427COW]